MDPFAPLTEEERNSLGKDSGFAPMTKEEREEWMQGYQKNSPGEYQSLHPREKQGLPPVPYEMWDPDPSKTIPISSGIANALDWTLAKTGEAFEAIDRNAPTGKPLRRAMGKFQAGEPLDKLNYFDDYFDDEAPTYSQLYENAGVPRPLAAVAGFGTEIGTDPLMYAGPLYRGAKAVAKKVVDIPIKGAAKLGLGVPGDTTQLLLDNYPEARRAAERGTSYYRGEIGSLHNLDDDLANNLSNTAKERSDELKEAFSLRKDEFANRTLPREEVARVQGALEKNKQYLKQLSDEADQVLEASNIIAPKEKLLKMIENLGKSLGSPLISDQDVLAVQKLQTLHERLQHLPDEVSGPLLRDVMQAVRKDTGWEYRAGEFNPSYDRLRKAFTEEISQALKNTSPEYKAYMDKMKGIVDAQNKMMRAFGDESSVASSIQKYKGSGQGSRFLRENIEDFKTTTGDNSFDEALKQIRGDYLFSKQMSRSPEKAKAILRKGDEGFAAIATKEEAAREADQAMKEYMRQIGRTDPTLQSKSLDRMIDNLERVSQSGKKGANLAVESRVLEKILEHNEKRIGQLANILPKNVTGEVGKALQEIAELQAKALEAQSPLGSFKATVGELPTLDNSAIFSGLVDKYKNSQEVMEFLRRVRSREKVSGIAKELEMKGAYDEFDKSFIRGSRAIVSGLGGLIFSKMLGTDPIVGGTLGAIGSMTMDTLGRPLVRGGVIRPTSFLKNKYKTLEKELYDAPKKLGNTIGEQAQKFATGTQAEELLKNAPEKLGAYGVILRDAMRKSPKHFTITHHILMNNFPAYRAIYLPEEGEGVQVFDKE